MIYKAISDIPATKVLAKLYQLYIVEYQCASILINQSHGVTDITVSANQTRNIAAQTVFFQIYAFLSSLLFKGLSSSSRDSLRILKPRMLQKPMVSIVHTVKNVIFRNPLFPFRML